MEVLRRLPDRGAWPAGFRSSWDAVLEASDAYGDMTSEDLRVASKKRLQNREAPSAAAITRMEEAITWGKHVKEPGGWKALCGWGEGVSERKIAVSLGTNGPKIKRLRQRAASAIAAALNVTK